MSYQKPARQTWRTSTPQSADDLFGRTLVGRAWRFFSHDIWQRDLGDLTGATRRLYKTARVIYLAARGVIQDDCFFRSMALTYITVLSLVPLLAFSFSLAKGLGLYRALVDDTIRPLIERTFADAPEMHAALDRVLEFVNETKMSRLGVPGLILLVYTVIKLLSTIERSFNDIWSVRRSRSVLRKVSDYLTIVLVTPIFLIVATAFTIAAQNNAVIEFLRESMHLGVVVDVVLKLVPIVAMWLGFTFVYLTMPNTRTRITSALLGGFVAAVMWQGALVLHIQFQVGIARYNALYSSFAAFPIFLMWMNICWITVLFGAEVCFAHESQESYVHIARATETDHASKEIVALRAMTRIARTFLNGGEPWSVTRLATELSVPQKPLAEVLCMLVERGLLAEVTREKDEKDMAYVPARDIDTTTVKTVLDALKGGTGPAPAPVCNSVDDEIARLMCSLDQEERESSFNVSLKQLAETEYARPESATTESDDSAKRDSFRASG
jgi:membrane protein